MKTLDVVIRHPMFMIPDDIYLRMKYRKKMKKKLNLENPVLFSEKMQWLKLYDRNPNYPNLVDKYEVRKYVAETIGEEHLIPLYGVWETFDEIPFDNLPDKFVLKCTHDSGSIVICKDKKTLNMKNTRRFFNRRLIHNYYWQRREWVYKNIKPRMIAEKLMTDDSGGLRDYKFYCFNGEPKIINVIFDRFARKNEKAKENFYSPQWEYLQMVSVGHITDPSAIAEKPECLEQMLDFARKLAVGKIHVRVDFYVSRNHVYFGELTFYGCAGYERFDPPHWDKTLGGYMTLPKNDS